MRKKNELERAELEEQVLRLRASNLSLRKIADKLGISRETVSGILKRAMKARNAENVSDFRAIALSRLDLLASAALPAALKGDTRSIDSVSKITTEQAKLLNAYDVRYFDVKIEREKYKAPVIKVIVAPREECFGPDELESNKNKKSDADKEQN